MIVVPGMVSIVLQASASLSRRPPRRDRDFFIPCQTLRRTTLFVIAR